MCDFCLAKGLDAFCLERMAYATGQCEKQIKQFRESFAIFKAFLRSNVC
jgi:hypothetical protein